MRGDPRHPANFGRLCTKGSTLHRTTVVAEGRALYPELRSGRDALAPAWHGPRRWTMPPGALPTSSPNTGRMRSASMSRGSC
ncbi:MAG: hypothetical protein MZW92_65425 [Comamonadaceae bacterium]|nr:hypothetical protein [Comamonadaceae bacterium]